MKSVLVISGRDNVGTALIPLAPGARIDVNGRTITVLEEIPSGHKVAIDGIGCGEAVIKYGSPIGVASAAIMPGAHVHIHNVASGRGRGDLPALPAVGADGPAAPRLAEPAND